MGKGSVKGLHYLRFIGMELLSESAFTLTFHKFFSNEVKNLIRSIEQVKFSPELRAWVLPLSRYEQLMKELAKICVVNNIHVEEIPDFAIQCMNQPLCGAYDYNLDDIKLKLDSFLPACLHQTLYSY
jgi:hypothetical protein